LKPLSITQHAGLIVPALLIGYFLLITNPPPDLLRYDNVNLHTATSYPLQGTEVFQHLESVGIFLLVFFLLALFLMFAFKEIFEGEEWQLRRKVYLLTLGTVALLGSTTLPYYGTTLMAMVIASGFVGMEVAVYIYEHGEKMRLLFAGRLLFMGYIGTIGFIDFQNFVSFAIWATVASILSTINDKLFDRAKKRQLTESGLATTAEKSNNSN
jgi:hypothetical protein